ncbi:glycosyltransferase family 2 protein [Fundidesulfovibrio butyratiphilus]
MSSGPLFSIIIPFKEATDLLDECLRHLLTQRETSYEIILLPDGPLRREGLFARPEVDVIPTGPVSPAIKRDLGAKAAKGEFLAFIDDDAYPEPDWLSVARKAFAENPRAAALGGPAKTPASDPFFARASGAVFLSRLSGGFPERYLPLPPRRDVDDWPTVNLMVRKDAFWQVGGFGSEFWPGEDTKFCMELVKKTGGTILYLPEMLVWHHRRAGLRKHLRQVGNYGAHRGYFSRHFPETSRRPAYFVPSLWLLFVTLGFFLLPGWLYATGVACYLAALGVAFASILRHEPLSVSLAALPFIVLTHLWYGWRFLRGLFTNDLKSTLGR